MFDVAMTFLIQSTTYIPGFILVILTFNLCASLLWGNGRD